MGTYHLVIDLATSRIIYFTSDLTQRLTTDEYSALVKYEGDLPSDLTNENCWLFVHKNKSITKPDKSPTIISNSDYNKQLIKEFIDNELHNAKYRLAVIMSRKKLPSRWVELVMKEHNCSYDRAESIITSEEDTFFNDIYELEKLRVDSILAIESTLSEELMIKIRQSVTNIARKFS